MQVNFSAVLYPQSQLASRHPAMRFGAVKNYPPGRFPEYTKMMVAEDKQLLATLQTRGWWMLEEKDLQALRKGALRMDYESMSRLAEYYFIAGQSADDPRKTEHQVPHHGKAAYRIPHPRKSKPPIGGEDLQNLRHAYYWFSLSAKMQQDKNIRPIYFPDQLTPPHRVKQLQKLYLSEATVRELDQQIADVLTSHEID